MKEKGKSSGRNRNLKWTGIAVLFVLILILTMSFAVTPVIAQPVEVRVNAPEYVEEGATFVATIDVNSVIDLGRAQFDLSFNPDVIKLSDIKEAKIGGEDISISGVLNPSEDTVKVIITMPIGEGVSGSGYLAEVEFKVKGDEGDMGVLDISNGMLFDKKGKVHLFTVDKKFKDELNDEEVLDNLKDEFEDNGYTLENPTVKVKTEDMFWDIIDFPNRVYGVRAQSGVLEISDTGEILANWIDAEIRIGEEEEEEEEEVGEEVTPGSPNITAWKPAEAVVSTVVGEPRTFNISVDQIAAISWQINGTEVQTNESTREAVYTNASADIGTWNVSAIATNTTTELSDVHTWIWSVTLTPAATVTPSPTLAPGVTPTPTPTLAPGGTPTPEPAEKAKPTPTPKPTPKPAVPGFEVIFAIVGMVAITYLLLRRR